MLLLFFCFLLFVAKPVFEIRVAYCKGFFFFAVVVYYLKAEEKKELNKAKKEKRKKENEEEKRYEEKWRKKKLKKTKEERNKESEKEKGMKLVSKSGEKKILGKWKGRTWTRKEKKHLKVAKYIRYKVE